jgi:hypothetical protein
VVEVDKSVVRPQPLPQLFPGNHYPGTFEQRFQQLKGLHLQPYARPIASEFAGREVDVKLSDANAMKWRGR